VAGNGLIAFARDDGIYAMRADGSGVRPLRPGAFAQDMAWSPDGRRLAVVADGAIWVMDADGGDATRVTGVVRPRFLEFVGWLSPSWSPDGRRIAYSYRATLKADRDVWVMNADGSNKRRLARTTDCSEVDVDWNPEGGRLVTTCLWGWGTRHLRLMNADGSNVHSLLTSEGPTIGSSSPVGASSPDWSPDGRRIVFAEFTTVSSGISVIEVADGTLVPLTDNNRPAEVDPVWSPDGRRIAFTRSDRDGGIYVMNANGTGLKKLTRGDNHYYTARSPAWQPIPQAP
jgi:Tol biopolymer transport system component